MIDITSAKIEDLRERLRLCEMVIESAIECKEEGSPEELADFMIDVMKRERDCLNARISFWQRGVTQ